MDFEEIRSIIETRMATFIGAPVAFDNAGNQSDVKAAIDAKTPWVRLTINHGQSLTSSIGDGPCITRTGLIQVQIFTPVLTGTKQAANIADSLAALLQNWQSGKLTTRAASLNRTGPNDGWYNYVISIPFLGG